MRSDKNLLRTISDLLILDDYYGHIVNGADFWR